MKLKHWDQFRIFLFPSMKIKRDYRYGFLSLAIVFHKFIAPKDTKEVVKKPDK